MELKDFFKEHPKAALAFSGGVDSSYLLYAARRAGADVTAYYVKTAFQPAFELEDSPPLSWGTPGSLPQSLGPGLRSFLWMSWQTP